MLLTDGLRLRCNYHLRRFSLYFGNGLDLGTHISPEENSMALVYRILCRAHAEVKSIQEYSSQQREKVNRLREVQVVSPNSAVGITDKPVLQLKPSYSQCPVIPWGSDSPGAQEVVHVCTGGITDLSRVGVALTAERRRSTINTVEGYKAYITPNTSFVSIYDSNGDSANSQSIGEQSKYMNKNRPI